MRKLFVWAMIVALMPSLSATAQDKKVTPEMQKKSAQEAMKAAKVTDATVVESANLILASSLPESRAKALVANMDKIYVLARKGLRYDPPAKDEPKTMIYAFGDVDVFRGYVRSVLKRSPDKDETVAMDTRADVPVIAVTAKRGETTPNYDQMVGKAIAELLLTKRVLNAKIEGWMLEGFQKTLLSRIDSKIGAAEKTKIRSMGVRALPKYSNITVTIAERAWGDATPERDAVAMSVMEFLTFGSGGSKLGDVLQGLVPSEEEREPTFAKSVKKVEFQEKPKAPVGKEWKETNDAAYLERAWRDWVSKGSPTVVK